MKKQSDRRKASRKEIERIEAKRREIGDIIYHDPRRAGEYGQPCEGTLFVEHKCLGRMELNEVIYPRNVFQKTPPEDWAPFYSEFNMSINCNFFHSTFGHRTKFRLWFLERMIDIFGFETIRIWNNGLPLEEGNRIIIDEKMP